MPTTRTKFLVSVIVIAGLLLIYTNGTDGTLDESEFSLADLFPKRSTFTPTPTPTPSPTPAPAGEPITSLVIYLNSKAAVGVSGEVLFYGCNQSEEVEGGFVCNTPGDAPLIKIPVKYGKAVYGLNSLYQNTPYVVYFHGTEQFYDTRLGDGIVFFLSEAGRNGSFTMMEEVNGVGRLTEMLNEAKLINGQTSTDLSEEDVEIGCINGCKDGDELLYDKVKGDSIVEIDIVLGCGGYGAMCKDVVLWFDFDFPKPEGNEFTCIGMEHISGLNLHIPEDLTEAFKSESWVNIGDLESGETATYRMKFMYQHYAVDENDPFVLRMDDLYRHGDIFEGGKADGVGVRFGFLDTD